MLGEMGRGEREGMGKAREGGDVGNGMGRGEKR